MKKERFFCALSQFLVILTAKGRSYFVSEMKKMAFSLLLSRFFVTLHLIIEKDKSEFSRIIMTHIIKKCWWLFPVLLCLLIRDYNNYFYGRSFIDYHKLPYGLTPYYNKDYIIENGNRVPIERFYLITDSSEFTGTGSSIPVNSHNTKFVISYIKSYYYNKDSIYVFCFDEENKPHWIIPVFDKGWVVFDETKNVKIENLVKYKCVSNFYDEK